MFSRKPKAGMRWKLRFMDGDTLSVSLEAPGRWLDTNAFIREVSKLSHKQLDDAIAAKKEMLLCDYVLMRETERRNKALVDKHSGPVTPRQLEHAAERVAKLLAESRSQSPKSKS